jgi:hypothetical protein
VKRSPLAAVAFVSALLGFVCLWGIGGLLAVALGVMAKAEAERTGMRAGLATLAIVLGVLNLVSFAAGLGALTHAVSHGWSPARPAWALTHATAPSMRGARAPKPAPGPLSTPAPPSTAATASAGPAVTLRPIGKITLVELGPAVRSLNDELNRQRRLAASAHQTLLVWLVVADCEPCRAIADGLEDPLMQKALTSVRLVKIDAREFSADLEYLRLPTDKVPGFALLGADNRAVDYVHGGEWDEDVPRNIAPVLGRFVKGRYATRRDPWRGGRRADEVLL